MITVPHSHLFICTRTSTYEDQPCPSAFRITIPCVDRRTIDDPDKNPNIGSKSWYSCGTNHRVENGQIVRDLEPQEAWAVKIKSLPALQAFVNEHGKCIISVTYEGYNKIEIYDTYRE